MSRVSGPLQCARACLAWIFMASGSQVCCAIDSIDACFQAAQGLHLQRSIHYICRDVYTTIETTYVVQYCAHQIYTCRYTIAQDTLACYDHMSVTAGGIDA